MEKRSLEVTALVKQERQVPNWMCPLAKGITVGLFEIIPAMRIHRNCATCAAEMGRL